MFNQNQRKKLSSKNQMTETLKIESFLEWKVFKKAIQDLQAKEPALFYSTPSINQCSIAILFRFHPAYVKNKFDRFAQKSQSKEKFVSIVDLENEILSLYKFEGDGISNSLLQFLLIKRAINPKDRHSGQLAFPGGHNEKDEADYQSAKRETIEEIGLNLDDSRFRYLGGYSRNFFIYKTSKKVFIRPHVFFYVGDDDLVYKLCKSEVSDIFWADFRLLVYPQLKLLIINTIETNAIMKVVPPKFQKKWISYTLNKLLTEIGYFRYQILPNEVGFYGISFHIMMYFVESGLTNMNNENFQKEIEHFYFFKNIMKKGFYNTFLPDVIVSQIEKLIFKDRFKYLQNSRFQSNWRSVWIIFSLIMLFYLCNNYFLKPSLQRMQFFGRHCFSIKCLLNFLRSPKEGFNFRANFNKHRAWLSQLIYNQYFNEAYLKLLL